MKRAVIILAVLLGVALAPAEANYLPPILSVNLPHSTTVSGALTTYALQRAWVTTEVFTFTATAQVTIPQATYAGQVLDAFVCQDGSGGHTPTFAAVGGLTITGTFPTFTTTLNLCGDFSLIYTTTTQAYIAGSAASN